MQLSGLRIQFVPQAVVQCEVWPQLPGVLHIKRREGTRLHVFRIAEALFVKRGQSQAQRLQRADARWRGIHSARHRRFKAQTHQGAGKLEKFKPAREKSLRRGVVAANQFLKSSPDGVVSAIEAEVVPDFIAASQRVTRKEDSAPKETVAFNVEARPSRIVGRHIKSVHVPLQEKFVLRRGTELMEPRTL